MDFRFVVFYVLRNSCFNERHISFKDSLVETFHGLSTSHIRVTSEWALLGLIVTNSMELNAPSEAASR
jgi:hypothetical protein